jgi:hypothetical protein
VHRSSDITRLGITANAAGAAVTGTGTIGTVLVVTALVLAITGADAAVKVFCALGALHSTAVDSKNNARTSNNKVLVVVVVLVLLLLFFVFFILHERDRYADQYMLT